MNPSCGLFSLRDCVRAISVFQMVIATVGCSSAAYFLLKELEVKGRIAVENKSYKPGLDDPTLLIWIQVGLLGAIFLFKMTLNYALYSGLTIIRCQIWMGFIIICTILGSFKAYGVLKSGSTAEKVIMLVWVTIYGYSIIVVGEFIKELRKTRDCQCQNNSEGCIEYLEAKADV